MDATPVLALMNHLFSMPRSNPDLIVASGLVLGTMYYISRIAKTCITYALDDNLVHPAEADSRETAAE